MRRYALAAAAVMLSAAGVAAAQADATVWDGVYTREQATRGAAVYRNRCASCHGDNLNGIESAPPLVGPAFYGNWDGETLEALFERTRISMPKDAPGSLSRAQNADVLAYILQEAGYPAGETPLGDRPGSLVRIRVVSYRVSGDRR